MFSLIINERAFSDQKQANLIAALRDYNNPNPITNEIIQMLSKMELTQEDVQLDTQWLLASIAVTGNHERANLTELMAQKFAIENNVSVIKWKLPVRESSKSLIKNENQLEIMYQNDSTMWGYFVKGGQAFLKDNNMNPTKGVANGVPVTFHSLTFAANHEKIIEIETIISNAKTGEVIVIPCPPNFINVELINQTSENWHDDETLIPGKVIIPVDLSTKGVKVKLFTLNHEDVKIYPKPFGQTETPTIMLDDHAVESGFAITMHKIQGKTIKKFIIELNERCFQPYLTFNMLLVALSRTETLKNMRIMPISPGKNLKYLEKLKPDPLLGTWFSGFENNKTWNLEKALIHYNNQKITKTLEKKETQKTKNKNKISNDNHYTNK